MRLRIRLLLWQGQISDEFWWRSSRKGTELLRPSLAQSCWRKLREDGITVHVRVVWGTPVFEAILQELREWRADLLVLGVHEPRPVPHTVLLDTDWQLIRLCPCPLLIAKSATPSPWRTVLAAVDPLHRHAEPTFWLPAP